MLSITALLWNDLIRKVIALPFMELLWNVQNEAKPDEHQSPLPITAVDLLLLQQRFENTDATDASRAGRARS